MPGSRSGPLPSNSPAQTRFSRDFLPRCAFPTTFEPGTDYKVVRALAAHLCGPGSNSGVEAICGSLLLVCLLCCERVLPGDSGFPFRHLHTSHNTPCLPLPKILHNLCFSVLLGVSAVPREIKNNAYAKFLGANKVYYGRCANGEFQLDQKSNRRRWLGAGFSLF